MAKLLKHIHTKPLLGFILAAVCLVLLVGSTQAQVLNQEAPPPDDTQTRVLTLDTINITGNHRTPDHIIHRNLGLEPGDPVDVDALEEARQRLLATDYFKTVEFSTRPGSKRGSVILDIEVVERSFFSIGTGFGYDDLHGWFLTLIELRFDNLFGIESRLKMGLRHGFRINGLDAEWETTAAYDGGLGVGIRGYVYNQNHLFYGSGPDPAPSWQGTEWDRYEQDINRAGAEFYLHYHLNKRTRFSFGYRLESNEPDSTFKQRETDEEYEFEELPDVIQADAGKVLETGVVLRTIRDTRDLVRYPRSGSFSLFSLEMNNSFLGGDIIYTRARLDLRKHFHLGGGRVFSTRLNGGIISSGAMYYNRFYIGGNYSIRGFREWSLSPTEGDDGFWLVNEELRIPLVYSGEGEPRLTGLIFLDAGQGWRRGDTLSTADLEAGVGYGVRLRLPWLGTLGLDVGIPLSEGRTGDPYIIHMLLGFSF